MILLAVSTLVAIVVFVQHQKLRRAQNRTKELQKSLEDERLAKRILEYELEGARALERRTRELIDATRQQLTDKFEAISHNTFSQSQRTFFDMAKQTFDQYHTLMSGSITKKQEEMSGILTPLRGSLEQMEKKVQELEVSRKGAYEGVQQKLQDLSAGQAMLNKETGNLVKALREPTVRGRWGEIQLRRVVEVAGMLSYCDFEEQVSTGSEGGAIRPDMLIRLPNDRLVVVDSKVSLSAYLDAIETENIEDRREKLVQHAKFVRQHVVRLSQKKYWDQFPKAPDFVVLFMHGDCFLAPALEQDKELLEFASAQRVLLTTPTSLIAMLKVIAYSWGEAKIEQHAQSILQEARTWLERCKIFSEHFCDIGRHLERGVKAYDKAVSSFENRLLVSVKRLAASGLQGADVESPRVIRCSPAAMQHERQERCEEEVAVPCSCPSDK